MELACTKRLNPLRFVRTSGLIRTYHANFSFAMLSLRKHFAMTSKMTIRAILFVPANRPDRFEKALATKADMICIDLEDGVAADVKESARQSLLTFLAANHFDAHRFSVRINDPTTELGTQDLKAIARSGKRLELLLIPKAEKSATVDRVFEFYPELNKSMVLIETAKGLSNVFALAAHESVSAVGFGSADWSTEIGCSMNWDALLYARSRIVHAAVEGNSAPIDGAWLHLNDKKGLEKESQRLRDLGFQGKIALHPNQISTILQSFSPDAKTIEQAKRILGVAMENPDGAFQVDGLIVDEPMIRRARHVLESVGISYSDEVK